jgi:hypothetical protein
MVQFSLGLITGVMMGVFIMCLMIMAGRGQEARREETWDEEPVMAACAREMVPGDAPVSSGAKVMES